MTAKIEVNSVYKISARAPVLFALARNSNGLVVSTGNDNTGFLLKPEDLFVVIKKSDNLFRTKQTLYFNYHISSGYYFRFYSNSKLYHFTEAVV